MMICAQETFLIIINVENSSAAKLFVENMILFIRIIWWIDSLNKQSLFLIECL